MGAPAKGISDAEVRTVARLARLELSVEQVEKYRAQLSAVLGHMQQLGRLDLAGVEPMTQPAEAAGRLAEDVPGPMLPTAVLMAMAPDALEPFVRVPRVIGDAGGA